MFGWGKEAEGIGKGVATVTSGIRHLITGDLPPETIAKLEGFALELDKLESKMLEGQVAINIEEAKGTGFKSNWRPAIGWIGVFGMAYHFIGFPILLWYVELAHLDVNPPLLDSEGLMALVSAMLGIGGYRTYEKFKGITK